VGRCPRLLGSRSGGVERRASRRSQPWPGGDALLTALRALEPPATEAATLVETTCAYYDTRRALLDYPRFRAQGYQIGSGVAESACKRVVGQRQKGSGMHWLPSGAQAIGTLRATALSNRWAEVDALCAA